MTDKKKSRGPGRPPGAPNRKRVPKSDALFKLSMQGMEMGIKHLMGVFTDENSSRKEKETAAKSLADLGKAFLMADLKEDLDKKPKKDSEDTPAEPAKTPQENKEDNVFSLKTYTADK